MFFRKSRENVVFDLFYKQTEIVVEALDNLEKAIELFLKNDQEFSKKTYEVHRLEHEADKVEMEIKKILFQGAFFAGIRNDFAELVVTLGDIAGSAVVVGRKFVEEKPRIPEKLIPRFKMMCEDTFKIKEPLLNAIKYLREDLKNIDNCCEAIKNSEKEVDGHLHKFITELFELDITLAEKLQLRDLALYMSKITDKAEDVTDKIDILAMNFNI